LSYDPTPPQALLLFGILARHGACAQVELMPKVKKADREALVKERLITAPKVGGGFKLALTDDGWAWAPANLSAALPPAQRTLSNILARLSEHLARSSETLADFIGSKPEEILRPPPARKRGKGAAKPAKPKATKPKAPSPAALRKRIEAAYLTLTDGRKNESVRLARLREKLSDLDRATVDTALGRILKKDKKASLMRHDDPHQLDQADHDAAFNPAGEPFHVIWIAS
jgi:hypothetical protein